MEFALWYVETRGSWKRRDEKWKNRVVSPRKNVWTCLLLRGDHRLNYRVAADVITYNELSARTTQRTRVYIIPWCNTYRYIPCTAGMFLPVHERIFLKKRLGAGFIIDFKTGQSILPWKAECPCANESNDFRLLSVAEQFPRLDGIFISRFSVHSIIISGSKHRPVPRFIFRDYIRPYRNLSYPSTISDFLAVPLFNEGVFPSSSFS